MKYSTFTIAICEDVNPLLSIPECCRILLLFLLFPSNNGESSCACTSAYLNKCIYLFIYI